MEPLLSARPSGSHFTDDLWKHGEKLTAAPYSISKKYNLQVPREKVLIQLVWAFFFKCLFDRHEVTFWYYLVSYSMLV